MSERKSAAGRKPLPSDQKRVQLTITITPTTAAWLREQTNAYTSIGTVIDRLVQGSQTMAEDYGNLYDYNTADYIRPATEEELTASREAAQRDGGAGVIEVDGRSCYVTEPA